MWYLYCMLVRTYIRRFEQKAVFAVVVPQLDYLRDALKSKGLEEVAMFNAFSLCSSKEAINLVSRVYTLEVLELCDNLDNQEMKFIIVMKIMDFYYQDNKKIL